MSVPEFVSVESRDVLVARLAGYCAGRLAAAIDEKGEASLMLSGGSTPKVLLPVLAQIDIDWSKVTVGLVDDRWLPEDHPDSNEGMVKETLLQGKAAVATFVPMYVEGKGSREAVTEVEQAMQRISRPFTLTLLGMGDDGHTASLHPCSKDLQAALSTEHLVAATTPGLAPHDRMTLSLSGLMASEAFLLLITGEGKKAVYDKACSDLSDEASLEMPIRFLIRQNTIPFTTYWAP